MKNIANIRFLGLSLFGVLFCVILSKTTLAAYEDCNILDDSYPLHKAIKAGNLEEALCLLKAGYDPNTLWKNGFSVLSLSVGENLEITKLLLEYGSDVNLNNAQAMESAFFNLGNLIIGRNSGDEYFNDTTISFGHYETLSEKIELSAQTLYALLDAGGDFNIVISSDDPSNLNRHIINFTANLCDSTGAAYSEFRDFGIYLNEISKRSKFVIRLMPLDIEDMKKLLTLSNLGLYDKACLLAFTSKFGAGI